jgi:hypothetical protein
MQRNACSRLASKHKIDNRLEHKHFSRVQTDLQQARSEGVLEVFQLSRSVLLASYFPTRFRLS